MVGVWEKDPHWHRSCVENTYCCIMELHPCASSRYGRVGSSTQCVSLSGVSGFVAFQECKQASNTQPHLLIQGEVLGKRVIQRPLEDYCGWPMADVSAVGECRNHLREVVPDLHCLLSNVVKPRLKQNESYAPTYTFWWLWWLYIGMYYILCM